MFNGEIIFHLKKIGTEKHMQTSGFFIDMNTYILTKSRNFKTFLKENYAVALDSCLKNFEHGIEHVLIVLLWSLHALDIPKIYTRFTEYLAIISK